jgi:hypothetical protein
VDKPLTPFTPLGNRANIGLSPKALSFYFSFADYLAIRGIVSPGASPFAFFAWLAHVLLKLAERIRSSLPDDRRAPEGLGLEGIRGTS